MVRWRNGMFSATTGSILRRKHHFACIDLPRPERFCASRTCVMKMPLGRAQPLKLSEAVSNLRASSFHSQQVHSRERSGKLTRISAASTEKRSCSDDKIDRFPGFRRD
jgi:hypothetical protein